jgi:hypothetical protein
METRELANTIYDMMVQYATTRVTDEQAKKDKVEKELAATGKTKATYDESVFNTNFLWSLDVIYLDTKTSREEVDVAMELLMAENKVERWFNDGKPMGCFYLKNKPVIDNFTKTLLMP